MTHSKRCIIVDDEALIRKLIQMKMDKKALNIEIVGEYEDAAAALSEFDRTSPDIIISDICMPGIDGITFAENCSEKSPLSKVILISGYNDFEYARRSLKAGVFDYLMKPIQTEELNQTLRQAVEAIDAARKERKEKERNHSLLRESYLNNLMISDTFGESQKQVLKEAGILDDYASGLCVGTIAIYESIHQPELIRKVKERAEECFVETKVDILIDPWERLILICREDVQLFREMMDLLTKQIQEEYQCRIQSGVSGCYQDYASLRLAYQDSLQNMGQHYSEAKSINPMEAMVSADADTTWEEVIHKLRSEKVADAICIAEQILDRIFESKMVKIADIRQICEGIAIELPCQSFATQMTNLDELCKTQQDLRRACFFYLVEVSVNMTEKKNNEKLHMMRKVIDFMEEHLSDPELNVKSLTDRYAVSISFLSRLFKGCTGKTYSDYLSEMRYWKLLQILKEEPTIRSFEAGSRIGIVDSHYLSIWFRKMSGYSLSEYRKMDYMTE